MAMMVFDGSDEHFGVYLKRAGQSARDNYVCV